MTIIYHHDYLNIPTFRALADAQENVQKLMSVTHDPIRYRWLSGVLTTLCRYQIALQKEAISLLESGGVK